MSFKAPYGKRMALTSMTPAQRKRQASRDRKIAKYNVPRALLASQKGFMRTGGSYGRYAPMGSELKFFDTALSFNVDATGEVPATGQLNLIPQGVTESTRVGRACIIKSIQIRGRFNLAPSAAATMSALSFVYVVLDTQCNGAAAAVADVLTGTNFSTALINIDNSQRFKILKRFTLQQSPLAGQSGALNDQVDQWDWYKKCSIPLDFSSTTGAITEIRSNNLFLLAGGVGADDLVSFAGTCRLRFSDK